MKKKILSLLLAFSMFFSFVSVSAEETQMHPDEQQVKEYSDTFVKTMIKVYAHDLADNYYYGVSDAELLYAVICDSVERGKVDVNGALEAMIGTLGDEYAEFYSLDEYKSLMEDVSGEFSGIGVIISQHENGVYVNSVLEDSPAKQAGIKDGDYITAISGTSIKGMSVDEVRNMIVGATDSEVTVTVLRGAETFDIICVRGPVAISNTENKMLTDETAYLRIIQFAQNTPDEVRKFVKELQQNNVKKLVIDLRNNPGGDLGAALSIAEIFISAGRVAELRFKDESQNTYLMSKNYNAPRLKIAVLVNENSASASEFLAMAFQSRGAGKLIGTKTYGKGSMQTVKRIATGAGMKYTIGEFYSIKGKRVNTVGITPDMVVENEVIAVDEESFVKIDYDRLDEAGKDGEMNLALEQRLEAVGLLENSDEVFDEKTVQAVKDLQSVLGYEVTGVPGFYEYMYLNDFDYDFENVIDKQLDAAVDYLSKR